MREVSRENIAAQLYGLLADLADGLEVQPVDAPFVDGADVTTFTDHTPPLTGAGVVVRTSGGQTFHVTVTTPPADGPQDQPEDAPGDEPADGSP